MTVHPVRAVKAHVALRALLGLCGLLLALLPGAAARADGGPAPVGSRPAVLAKDKPFKAQAEVVMTSPQAGKVRVSVWMFKDDHYIYQERSSVAVAAPEGVTVGAVVAPPTKTKYDPNFDKDVVIHVGTPTFEVPIDLGAVAPPVELKLTVKYQGCNPVQCFFPATEQLTVTVPAAGGQKGAALPAAGGEPPAAQAAAPANVPVNASASVPANAPAEVPAAAAADAPAAALAAVVPADAAKVAARVGSPAEAGVAAAAADDSVFDTDVKVALGKSVWLAFLVAFLAGILTSLTPCVYPVIPITLRVLGASQAERRIEAFSLAFVYVLGMAAVYTGLGVVAAATGGLFGAWLQSQWVVATLVVIFIAMGFSMLGAFDIALPSGLATRLSNVQGRGYPGAFLAGTVSGVVVGPCSAPVLLSLLGYIAESGNVGLGSALMFTYAMGMGVLFLVIGTFAASLPRSGGWMDSIKGVLALMIFGVALWYMRLLTPSPLPQAAYLFIVGGFGLAAGTFVGAFHPVTWEDGWDRKARKTLGILATAAGLLFVLDGLLAARGIAGGLASFGQGRAPAEVAVATIPWTRSEAEGLARAREEGRPALVDFTAEWCAVCQEIEHEVYTDPRVVARMKDFVPILVDGTNDTDPQFVTLKAKYVVPALPKVVFIDASGEVLEELAVTELVTADEFLRRMDVAANSGRTARR